MQAWKCDRCKEYFDKKDDLGSVTFNTRLDNSGLKEEIQLCESCYKAVHGEATTMPPLEREANH